jgi:hypothetical protein
VEGAITEFAWSGWGKPLKHSARVFGKSICVLLVSCDTCKFKNVVLWDVMPYSLLCTY